MAKLVIPAEFENLLPTFKKKLFYNFYQINYFWVQKYSKGTKKWQYSLVEQRLNDQYLLDHFYRIALDFGNHLQGFCLGFKPSFGTENIVKRIVIDVDNLAAIDKMNTLVLPQWDSLGFEYTKEPGRLKDGVLTGAHYSLLTEAKDTVTKPFLRQLFAEIGEPILKEDVEFLGKPITFDEVYGASKLKENCRFILGANLKYEVDGKRGLRTWIEYKDEQITDPVEVLKTFINMKPITSDFMEKYIKPNYFPTSEDKKKSFNVEWSSQKFVYQPVNLPIPDITAIPPKIRPIFRNCQALNTLLNEVYEGKETNLEKGLIQDKGYDHHEGGFYFTGPFRYHDVKYDSTEGKQAWKGIVEENRDRDESDHNWWYGPDKEAATYVAKCKTYDDKLDLCKGCPFKGKIESPRVFTYSSSSPISRTLKSTDIKLATLDQIRNHTFPRFKKRVKALVDDIDGCEDILLCSVMGVGKTVCAVELTAELVLEKNLNVIISVHDSKAALSYRTQLKAKGIEVFNLSSHASTFGHQATPPKEASLSDLDCPYYAEIQAESKSGVQSSSYKAEYCDTCPLLEKCYYPNQYTQVMEEKYKVVIIQHAHLSCQEVMYKLLEKGFGALFIDETFIDSTFDNIPIEELELEVLGSIGYDWTDKLHDWLRCMVKARGKLTPTKEELDSVLETYTGWGIVDGQGKKHDKPWRIPDLIRLYNQHRHVNELSGIEVVYELPQIPVRIFLDATPPEDLIKHLTGINHLVKIGDKEVIDIQSIHPDHKRYQIIDMSNSQTQMSKESFFEVFMTKTCEIIERDYGYKKALITVYKSERDKVIEFIQDRFPILLKHPYTIDIALMNKGTNKWAAFDIQFILAGRYRLGREYFMDCYKYKAVANAYRIKKDLPILRNIYPKEMSSSTSIYNTKVPVQCLVKVGKTLRIAVYNDFHTWTPDVQTNPNNDYYWFGIMDALDKGDMMQTERLRWDTIDPSTGEVVPKVVIHAHNKFMDKLPVEPILFSDFLQF